jgi:hypothetical protein
MDDVPSTEIVLAGDAERERAVEQLRDAIVAGRLTLEEFSARVDGVHAARTTGELAVLTRDLPAGAPPVAEPGRAHRAICSHLVRSGPMALGERTSFTSIFGTIDLDLRHATIAAAEVELQVHNVFGSVTVVVPDGVVVEVEGGGLFASEDVEMPDTPPLPGAPVIRIRTSGPGGTLQVRTA